MLDGKMSAILSGAGGASCQLCTTHFDELKDLDLIRAGYPINRSIKDAKLIFETVDEEEFLSLPSNERSGLTHALTEYSSQENWSHGKLVACSISMWFSPSECQ